MWKNSFLSFSLLSEISGWAIALQGMWPKSQSSLYPFRVQTIWMGFFSLGWWPLSLHFTCLYKEMKAWHLQKLPFLWCELHGTVVGLQLTPGVFNLGSTDTILFLPLGCRLGHSSSLLKATKMQTIGCGVLKQNLSLRTLTDNYCCSLSGWLCWTTSSATLVSSQACSMLCARLLRAGMGLEVCRNRTQYLVKMVFPVSKWTCTFKEGLADQFSGLNFVQM